MKKYQALDLPLQTAVRYIKKGVIQLPEFQRDFKWSRKARLELLDSVQKGFPAGSLLLLEVAGKKSPFGIRPFAYVSRPGKPRFLVLDGQQRLATCYTAFLAERNDVFAIDLGKLFQATKGRSGVDVDFDTLIVSRRRPRILDELLYSKNLLPLPLITDADALRKCLGSYRDQLKKHRDTVRLAKFVDVPLFSYIDSFLQYEFPCVVLPRDLDLEAVCNVFTKINTTGLTLSAFDLCVATLYPQRINLRERLRQAQKNEQLLLSDVDGTNILQTIALLAGKPSKKAALPKNLSAAAVQSHWDDAVDSLVHVAQFLSQLGISEHASVPYDALIPALAAAFTETKNEHKGARRQELLHKRVAQWIYQTALAERYNEGTDVKQQDDFVAARRWFKGEGDSEPNFLSESPVWSDSVVYTGRSGARAKAFIAAMNERGPTDWMTRKKVGYRSGFQDINLHHIFPRQYLKNRKTPDREIERVLNLTILTSQTNNFMSDRPPSIYLRELIERVGKDSRLKKAEARKRVADLLEEHFISSEAFEALLKDDYDGFLHARARAVRSRLESRFGVSIGDTTGAVDAVEDEPDDEVESEVA